MIGSAVIEPPPCSSESLAERSRSLECITTLFRLKNMETALPSESFMRVHRSYIVNLRTIKAYVKGRIFLNDTEYVPIGENYKEAFQGYIDKNFRNL